LKGVSLIFFKQAANSIDEASKKISELLLSMFVFLHEKISNPINAEEGNRWGLVATRTSHLQ